MRYSANILCCILTGNCLSAEAMNTLWNVVSLLQLLLELIEKEKDSPSNTSVSVTEPKN